MPLGVLDVLEPEVFHDQTTGMNREKEWSSRENQRSASNIQNQIIRMFYQKFFFMCCEALKMINSQLA